MIEPALLFWLLFLPGISLPAVEAAAYSFEAGAELSRVLLFDLPALALVVYLLAARQPPLPSVLRGPVRSDAVVAVLGFAALALCATATGALAAHFAGPSEAAFVEAPSGAAAWAAALLSCATTGYLEETFFRAYLHSRLTGAGLSALRAAIASTALFAICHLYEGPWGVLNSAMAGGILSLSFLFRKSVHGAAWAHGSYNLFVYIAAA